MQSTLVLIPAYNEEKNIGKVLNDIKGLNIDEVDILVINDGSQDDTESEVLKGGCKIISLPYNLGYGGALQTGFKYAVSMGYKYVIQFDGDGQHVPDDIKLLIQELQKDNVDIVIGSRFLSEKRVKLGLVKKAAIALFRLTIKAVTNVRITDPTSGLQGLSRAAYSHYAQKGNYPSDYPDADILIKMVRAGYRVAEIPADIRNRNYGKSMHSGLKPVFYFSKIFLSIIVILLREKFSREGYE